jgi:hypothetical protein
LKGGRPASEESISKLEKAIGASLPDSYRAFLKRNDGAEPATNIFRVGQGMDSGVNEFIPVTRIPREARLIENLQSKAFPIAWAEGGNYVVLDAENGGRILFWDHERPETGYEIGPDFDAFLEALEPFGPDSVQVQPGQVKEVRIRLTSMR